MGNIKADAVGIASVAFVVATALAGGYSLGAMLTNVVNNSEHAARAILLRMLSHCLH